MWVQERDVHHFGNRSKMAVITKFDAVDSGLPLRMFYKLLDMPEFGENLVRSILQRIYGDVSKWILVVVLYDISKDAWLVRVESPDFEPVPLGITSPEIERKEKAHAE